MSITFSADEIFEIAEQIERNGAKFYRNAALLFPGEPLGDKLLGLAAMEDEHEKTFSSMRDELPQGDIVNLAFDPDNQAALYLQAAADGKVFDLSVEPSSFLSDEVTAKEVFEFAIVLEKDSVVFYTSVKEVVSEDLGKSRIDDIIMQEIGHISYLREQIEALKQ